MEKKFLCRLLPVLFFICFITNLEAQTIRYVKQGGSGDGSSWANASGDFQAMINASAANDEVWVAAGDYRNQETHPFIMKEGVEIYGGFPNSGNPVWSDRNFTTQLTRLLGNPKYFLHAGTRVIENNNNALTVAAVLDGFTLTDGIIRSGNGGAMYNYNASPTIRNCVFRLNSSGDMGGAIYNQQSSPAIINCTFSENSAGNEVKSVGGAIANISSHPVITNCVFDQNKVWLGELRNGGGGMYNQASNPIISNCRFTANESYAVGAVYNLGSSPQFINTLFSGNKSSFVGAVQNYSSSNSVFKNCIFSENIAEDAGAIGVEGYSAASFINCLFAGNAADGTGGSGKGGAIYNVFGDCNIINCTFSGNTATLQGGTIYSTGFLPAFGNNVRIKNSIIYGNSSGVYMAQNFGSFENSLIQDHTPNGGSVQLNVANSIAGSTNPLFVNTANPIGADGVWGTADDGYQLQSTSICVNKGNNTLLPVDLLTDLAGEARIKGRIVDAGAYEAAFVVDCSASVLYVDGNVPASGTGNSWSTAFKTLSEAMERAADCNNVNTILVARGTYYPTGEQNGNKRDSAFLIPQRGGLKIYGGYPNGGGICNAFANPTILSGDIGAAGINSDNSYHIMVLTEALPGADSVVIEGFTFTKANANGGQYSYNNVLTNQDEGGAILFRKNNNIGSRLAIRNCNIINNNANSAAGIYLWQSSALISNCVIAGNTALNNSAGVFSLENSSVKLINAVLSGNTAKNGAAVYNNSSALEIVNSTISGNTASEQGSAIYNIGSSSATVENSVLYNNGINNIQNSAALNITYSDVQQGSGIYTGTGNLNDDPLFGNAANAIGADGVWRTADDGLKLQLQSPLVNAGNPDLTGILLNPFDLQNAIRVFAGRIDIGAYESSGIRCNEIADIIYVDASVMHPGNGASWSTALASLSDALQLAGSCGNIKTILVAKGTYYPTTSADRSVSFLVPARGDLKIYGGYPAGGGVRNIAANPTILSGDIGVLNNNTDNSYHVMLIVNISAGADSVVLDGLQFTGANGDNGSAFTVNGVNVNGNLGGGISIIQNNGNTKIAVRNCRFTGNKAHQGAGVYINGSEPVMVNTFVQGNISTDNGGGISNYGNSNATFINTLIAGNQASYGGAFFNDDSRATFINSTIAGNLAIDAAGFYNRYANANIGFRNSIVYGNRRGDGAVSNIFNTSDGKASFRYSLIENSSGIWDVAFGTDAGNNLFSDPQFVNLVLPVSGNMPNANGDYQVQSGSSVVDAGDNGLLPAGVTADIINTNRVQQIATDMGAFESPWSNCAKMKVDTAYKNILCNGQSSGEASVTVKAGVAPFTYNWSNGAVTAAISNIAAGNYTCTVSDANGCSVLKVFTITEPADVFSSSTTQTNIKCYGDAGAATVQANGGTAPYVYNWSNGESTGTISNLQAAQYSCTVTDANGCTVAASVIITGPASALTASVSQTDILCYGAQNGKAEVVAGGGVAPYSFSWNTGSTGSAIQSLAAGNYTCTITDAAGCSIVKTFTLTEPAMALAATVSATDILCNGANSGTAAVAVTGGTAPYIYNWNNGGSTAAVDHLTAGNYSCVISDAHGCEVTASLNITEPAALTAQLIFQKNIYCTGGNTGEAVLQAAGGVAPYAYAWSNGGHTAGITGLAAAHYTCVITDANNCTVNAAATITQTSIIGNTIYVDSAVVSSGNGDSWAGAFKTLTEALTIANACSGVENILVAKGTYKPVDGIQNGGKDNTFLIRQSGGLKIYGGYPSGGGIRNSVTNITTLSGEIGGGGPEDNSGHIMVIAGLSTSADSVVVDGFNFTLAFTNFGGTYWYNGIEVSNNGGAISLYNTNNAGNKIAIRNCSFNENYSMNTGGAIYNYASSPSILNCTFNANYALTGGGAIMNENTSSAIIRDCKFIKNESGLGGGAIYNLQNSNASISNSRFIQNATDTRNGGGAIANDQSTVSVLSCYLDGNFTRNNLPGGAIYNTSAIVEIINSIIVGNKAANSWGGGIANYNHSSVTLSSCTIYANLSIRGSVQNDNSQITVINTIISGSYSELYNANGGTATVSYSLVDAWAGGGTGNLPSNTDPKFVYGLINNGDYRLSPCSPAINAGTTDTTGLHLPDIEMSDLPRVQLSRIDIGAMEANSLANETAAALPAATASTTAYQLKNGTTWYAIDCQTLIAAVTGTGTNPVHGNTTARVYIDVTQLPAAVSRVYEITPDNDAASASGTITLFFTQAEFSAYNAANTSNNKLPLPDKDDPDMNDDVANIRIRKISGGVTGIITPTVVNWNAGLDRWELTFNVAGFSKFYVFTPDNTALPLRLISFGAQAENCVANISWTTAEEFNVLKFELEHSVDAQNWNLVSTTQASNTSGEHTYKSKVNISNTINFYRLKMTDIDGTTSYSKVVRITAPLNCSSQQLKLYPNPASDILYLEGVTPGDLYTIYDNAGRIVLQSRISKTVQDVHVNMLVMGMYTITVVNKSGDIKALKFVKK